MSIQDRSEKGSLQWLEFCKGKTRAQISREMSRRGKLGGRPRSRLTPDEVQAIYDQQHRKPSRLPSRSGAARS